jgi:pyruvate formate lyase activating enzyme
VRVPVIPGVNDGAREMRAIGALAGSLPSVARIELLPYHRIGVEKYGRIAREYSLPELRPPSPEQITALAQLLRQDSELPIQAG